MATGNFDDDWLIANVHVLRGDADRWAYSQEIQSLFSRYVAECDRRMDVRRLYFHLIDLRKRRYVRRPAGDSHLPESRDSGWEYPLDERQEEELVRLYRTQDRNVRELAYTKEFDLMHGEFCMRMQSSLTKHDLWCCLDTLRKNGRLPRRGRDRTNLGRRKMGMQ